MPSPPEAAPPPAPAPAGKPLRNFLLRLLGAYVGLMILFQLGGSFYASRMLPVVKWGLGVTHSELTVKSLDVEARQVQLVAAFVPTEAEQKVIGIDLHGERRAIETTLGVTIDTLLVCPILALALVLAWPHASMRARLQSLLFAVPLIALFTAFDTPGVLAQGLARRLAGNAAPPRTALLFGMFILDNGGRQLASLAIGWLAIWLRGRAGGQPEAAAPTGAGESGGRRRSKSRRARSSPR